MDRAGGFLYFVEGPTARLSAAELAALKLGHAWDAATPTTHPVTGGGPGGGPGVVVALGAHVPKIGYYPNDQTWVAFPDATAPPKMWVGWFTATPPTPEALARRVQLQGKDVRLEDGQTWIAPVARKLVTENNALRYLCRLPSRSILTASGEWERGAVVETYQTLWKIACDFWDAFAAGLSEAETDAGKIAVAFDFDNLHNSAAAALSANYRVGPVELAAIGALSERAAMDILNAAVDMDFFLQWLAENHGGPESADAGLNSERGPTAATPPTRQPLPS